MRTTLEIDDDVLAVARRRARREKRSVGALISERARRSLTATESVPARSAAGDRGLRKLGIEPLQKRGGFVTNELINQLRDASIS